MAAADDGSGAPVVDLRSDTVTRPSPAMRAAMAEAEVGDDVYGEDPTVGRLERPGRRAARARGGAVHPDRVAGQPARRCACSSPPGQELLCDVTAHVARAELGARRGLQRHHHPHLGRASGVGWTPRSPLAMMQPDAGPYFVSTGRDRGREHAQLRRRHGAAAGSGPRAARAGSRAPACGCTWTAPGCGTRTSPPASPAGEWGALFDTVSVCLSKGLGAPVGSVLVGGAELIAGARVWRKRYGAGMRQVGVLAAAGHYALDHHVERLADDHAHAALIAQACAAAAPSAVVTSTTSAPTSSSWTSPDRSHVAAGRRGRGGRRGCGFRVRSHAWSGWYAPRGGRRGRRPGGPGPARVRWPDEARP